MAIPNRVADRLASGLLVCLSLFSLTIGCATVPLPQWTPGNEASEAEYAPFLEMGTASLSGQAFLTQQGGGVVKAAGRTVTLDPATSIGIEWWKKAGRKWVYRYLIPPSPGFLKARRATIADADGKFKFSELPAGRYFVRTEVTWETGGNQPTQGGLVGQLVEIKVGQSKELVLAQFAN